MVSNLEIHKVNRKTKKDNRYCGPAVISALTKIRTGNAARLLRKISKQSRIIGVNTYVMLNALNQCKIKHDQIYLCSSRKNRITLAKYFRDNPEITENGPFVYLISAGNHWQLVKGESFVCGITKDIVSITHEKVRRRCRVGSVWKLSLQPGVIFPEVPDDAFESEKVIQKRKVNSQYLREAKKIIEEYNLSYTYNSERFYNPETKLFETAPEWEIEGPWGYEIEEDEWEDICEASWVSYDHEEFLYKAVLWKEWLDKKKYKRV
tara:strand:+ start:107 stop:898 length:792 start_codon:yes stop_codon:yes gene_type:complete